MEVQRGNRADRRRQARQRDRISQEIIHKAQQQLNDGRVEAMMVCMALGLHQEFGFDRDDCLRALRAVDSLMDPWIRGERNLEDMQRQVREEIGIEIRC